MTKNALSFEWRKWIAQNVALKSDLHQLREVLIRNNFSEEAIDAELQYAQNHPYIAAIEEANLTLKKREWLLETLNKHYVQKHKYSEGWVLDEAPSAASFFKEYYNENRPLLIKNGANHWSARHWTPELLKEKIGDKEVEVQFGRSHDNNYEQNGTKLKRLMPFNEYIDMVQSVESSNDFYMTANNTGASMRSIEVLYQDIGNIADGYLDVGAHTKSGFIWIGPKGTYTPLHHDLTNNLFVQLHGRKKFWLIPACDAPHVYNSVHVFSPIDMRNPDVTRFPKLQKANIIEHIIEPGEVLFIPIGWWHAVESLDISISASFTNFNAPNYFEFPRQ